MPTVSKQTEEKLILLESAGRPGSVAIVVVFVVVVMW
jgi:hypothetical protein